MTIAPRRIHDVTLLAANVAELRAFYASLGFAQVYAKGDDLVVFAAGENELALHASSEVPRAAVTISLIVDDTGDLVTHLRTKRIPFDGPMPLRPGMDGIRLRDPNGNVLELLVEQS